MIKLSKNLRRESVFQLSVGLPHESGNWASYGGEDRSTVVWYASSRRERFRTYWMKAFFTFAISSGGFVATLVMRRRKMPWRRRNLQNHPFEKTKDRECWGIGAFRFAGKYAETSAL
jgi:hypothetical protein